MSDADSSLQAFRHRLFSGWRPWYGPSPLAAVFLPEALVLDLSFAEGDRLTEPDLSRDPSIEAGPNFYDGSYWSCSVTLSDRRVLLEYVPSGEDLCVRLTPLDDCSGILALARAGFAWGFAGRSRRKKRHLGAKRHGTSWKFYARPEPVVDRRVSGILPVLSIPLESPVAITSNPRLFEDEGIEERRSGASDKEQLMHQRFLEVSPDYTALQRSLAWASRVVPEFEAVASVPDRVSLPNPEEALVAALLLSLDSKTLCYANLLSAATALDGAPTAARALAHVATRIVAEKFGEPWIIPAVLGNAPEPPTHADSLSSLAAAKGSSDDDDVNELVAYLHARYRGESFAATDIAARYRERLARIETQAPLPPAPTRSHLPTWPAALVGALIDLLERGYISAEDEPG